MLKFVIDVVLCVKDFLVLNIFIHKFYYVELKIYSYKKKKGFFQNNIVVEKVVYKPKLSRIPVFILRYNKIDIQIYCFTEAQT